MNTYTLRDINTPELMENFTPSIKRAIQYLLLTILLFIIPAIGNSQAINDFKSIQTGNWQATSTWQIWNGTTWVAATYYPGNGATGNVIVEFGHTVTVGVVVTLTQSLTVSGTLTLGTSNFTVAGNTLVTGILADTSNTGTNLLQGTLEVTGTGSIPVLRGATLWGGIKQNSSGNINITTTTIFSGSNQTISGSGSGSITFATADISNNIQVTNQKSVLIMIDLRGLGANAVFVNDVNSQVEYRGTNIPMATGQLVSSANGNIFYYNANAEHTIKFTDYFHLHFGTDNGTTDRNKDIQDIAGTLNVFGNLNILHRARVNTSNLQPQHIIIHGNLSLSNSNAGFYTRNADVIHAITIHGNIINNGQILLRRDNQNRFADLTMTGSGNIITGTGIFTFRSIKLTNSNPKVINTSSNIDFLSGNTIEGNGIDNTGGQLSFVSGNVRIADASSFYIKSDNEITFNNLWIGSTSHAAIAILQSNIRINKDLYLYHNSSGYLDMRGYRVTVLGTLYRRDAGQFRGNNTSELILGNGNTISVAVTNYTNLIAFQAGFNQLGKLYQNVVNSGLFYSISAPVIVDDIEIAAGELRNTSDLTLRNSFVNNGIYAQTAGTTFFSKPGGGTIAIVGSGTHTFHNISIENPTSLITSTSFNIRNNFISNSNAPSGFLADAGAAVFNVNANDHFIQGTGSGTVTFNNLTYQGTGIKYIARSINVTNSLQINNGANVFIDNAASHVINVKDITVGQGVSGQFQVRNSGTLTAPHQLNISGRLAVLNGATFRVHLSTVRYAGVTFSGEGDVLSGNGSFSFQSVSLTNNAPKSFVTSSLIYFYRGDLSPNHFTNNGGAFNPPDGIMYFRDNSTAWQINGTGDITFGKLRIGANTTTNMVLNRNITISESIIFSQNTSLNYLDLNGNTLTLIGDHSRVNDGRFRGRPGSQLIIEGTGNFTSAFVFDQSTPGTTNYFDGFIFNRDGNGELRLSNLIQVHTLDAIKGILNSFGGSITVIAGGLAHFKNALFIDTNAGGINTFLGTLIIDPEASFNPTANSELNLGGIITNNGFFTKEGDNTINFPANTVLQGNMPYFFLNGTLLVAPGIRVVNQVNVDTIGVFTNGRINGSGANSTWDNRSYLVYNNANEPMGTGDLVANHVPNTFIYSRQENSQNVKGTTYHNLVFRGGGNRTLMNVLTVNGNLTIGEKNIVLCQEFQITGNLAGRFVMEAESELVIGRDVVSPQPGFPTLFIGDNIEFDEISIVRFDGRAQNISHVPVYSNLAISRAGGNKTITGNVTVNGYLLITSGTLAFGSDSPKTLVVNGDLIGNAGAVDLRGGPAHQMQLNGLINQVNRFYYAPGTLVRYSSIENQQVFAPTDPSDHYARLQIEGGSSKSLDGNIRIYEQLILTSGRLSLGDFNVTLYNATVSGDFNDNTMIETNGAGFLERSGTGGTANAYMTGIYPIGSQGRYSPVRVYEIGGAHANGRYFRIKAVPVKHQSIPDSYDALVRFWEFQTNAGNGQARVDMFFSPLDVIGDQLLYKAYQWNGSAFLFHPSIQMLADRISLTTLIPIQGQWTAYDNETVRKTFYSYLSGPWNDVDTWTTDPSGQLLEGSRVPGASDNAVILSGRTVELTEDIHAKGLNIEIRQNAILDLNTFRFTQIVSTLKGEGVLRIASNSMPLVALNQFVQPQGGTVEYNVAQNIFELNNQAFYNNLTINLPDQTNTAVLVNNLEVFGHLKILQGGLQIFRNDPTSNVYLPITLTVGKDIYVQEKGFIATGTASTTSGSLPPVGTTPGALVPRYYDIYHKVHIGGSLINEGQVKFISNDITIANFANLTSRGAATVRFFGTENAVLECMGASDFYNVIVDKGLGAIAELEINAFQPDNFRLFGANRFNAGTWGINPEVRKALWIRNGILRLTGYTSIASLTEGRGGTNNSSWIIPANAALILDSPNVTVLVTADTPGEVQAIWGVNSTGVHKDDFPQELLLLGSLQINDGYLSTRMSGGIVFARAGGEATINGGKVSARQIRTAHDGSSVFYMDGGELELLGRYHHLTSNISTLEQVRTTAIDFNTQNSFRLSNAGTLNLAYSNNVFQMSGGVINIYNTSGDADSRIIRIMAEDANVTATAGKINIFITRNTPHNIEVPYGALPGMFIHKATSAGTSAFARLMANLRLNGDLHLSGFTQLLSNTSSYNLSLGDNFIIDPNASYVPGQNTTRFLGNTNSTLTANGTINSGFYNLEMDKGSDNSLTISGSIYNYVVRNNLTLSSGTLNDNGKTVIAQRHIYNSAIHTGTGKILMAGGTVSRNLGGNGSGEFGNLELNQDDGIITTLLCSQKVNGIFTHNLGILHLGEFGFTLEQGFLPAEPSHYSATRMIRTNGLLSDKGLKVRVGANGTHLFPVGTNREDKPRYTPATVVISNLSDEGYIRVNPVGQQLPTLNQQTNKPALQFYWRILGEEFDTAPNTQWTLVYDEQDVPTEDSGGNPIINADDQFIPGKVVGASRLADPGGLVDYVNNQILFSPENLTTGNYTAAHPDRFLGVVPVFYSRISGTQNWSAVNTWSESSHTGDPATRIPGSGDIVYIGNGGVNQAQGGNYHWVLANQNVEVAELHFTHPPAGVWQPRLIIEENRRTTMGSIHGEGTIMIRVSSVLKPEIVADWGEFLNNNRNWVIFDLRNDATTILSVLSSEFPNLRLEAGGNTSGLRIAVFPVDIKVRGDMRIDRGATLLLSDGETGDIYVNGNTQVGGNQFGRLQFTGGTRARVFSTNNLTITNTDDFFNNNVSVLATPANALVHRLEIRGNITQQQGSITLFSNNSGGNNVELVFTKEQNSSFTVLAGNLPNLYRITINKGASQLPTVSVNTNMVLNAPSDIAIKPINLVNGTIILNHPSLNVNLSTGGGSYLIPASAAFVVSQGRGNITNQGINLRGKLRLENEGALIMGGQNSNRIILQYEGLLPELEIAGNARLEINSQIRRPTNTINGSLKYRQTGGLVIIHGIDANNERARLEITNNGSEFTMSGGRIIIRRSAGNLFGDLWLIPQVNNVTGGEIILSQGVISAQGSFPGYPVVNNNYTFRVNSSSPLFNLTIGSDPGHNRRATLLLMNQSLIVHGNLVFRNDFTELFTNNRDVEIKGDLQFRGAWVRGTTETIRFTGANQSISGSPQFTHFIANTAGSLTLNAGAKPVINGNFSLLSGQFVDGSNPIRVKGNVSNNGLFISSNPTDLSSGLKMVGEVNQKLSGVGIFGLIEVDNPLGITLQNSITMENDLILNRGNFNIGSYLLTLGQNAIIKPLNPFSFDNMVLTDGFYGENAGVKKYLSAQPVTMLFPMGVQGKYTPAQVTVSQASTSGSVLVKPVNSFHPTALDPNNVLHYFWILKSEGLSGFLGDVAMEYMQNDAKGTESSYLAARFIDETWTKFLNDADFTYIDVLTNKLRFMYSEGDKLDGHYSAGIDEAFSETLPTFTTIKENSNWDDLDAWSRSDGQPVSFIPSGVNIVVATGTTLRTNGNRRQAYTVTVYGRLELGETFGHNFGRIAGNGTIASGRETLPAGIYTDFFSTPGHTMEYGGSRSFIINPDYTTNFQNLIIAGSGTKTLPSTPIIINGYLRLKDNARLNQGHNITIRGDFELLNNSVFEGILSRSIFFEGVNISINEGARLNCDYGSHYLRLNGSTHKIIQGNLITANSRFQNIEVNSPRGVSFIGNFEVRSFLTLRNNSVVVIPNPAHELYLWGLNPFSVAPSQGSYISGKLKRRLAAGSNHIFPVGKNGIFRQVTLNNVTATTIWTVEYFDGIPPFNTQSRNSNLSWVPETGYWSINGPNGATARVQLSGVIDATYPFHDHPQVTDFIVVAEWSGTQWFSRGQSSITTAGNRFNVNAGIISGFSLKHFTIGQSSDIIAALPIELLSFTARFDKKEVLLDWITASETNNDYFTIERSSNATDFQVVAVIASKAEYGNSNRKLFYSAIDNEPLTGLAYYRLKQTDFDGTSSYSNIIAVNSIVQSNQTFSLYPNPNRGNGFNMVVHGLTSLEKLVLQVVDLGGRTVHYDTLIANESGSLHSYIIPEGLLNPGIYIVHISGISGKQNFRMVVNN